MSHIIVDSCTNEELAAKLLSTNFAGTVLQGTPETDEDYATGLVIINAAQEKFNAADDLPEADETATDGATTVKKYTLEGATVFIEIGEHQDGLHIYPAGISIKTLLRDFETGDLDMAEHLASWGFDGTPDEADETATDVRIWCEPNYYSARIGHYVSDKDIYDRDALIFPTVAEAQAWIDSQEEGIYCTSHGEAGRPAYTICE